MATQAALDSPRFMQIAKCSNNSVSVFCYNPGALKQTAGWTYEQTDCRMDRWINERTELYESLIFQLDIIDSKTKSMVSSV